MQQNRAMMNNGADKHAAHKLPSEAGLGLKDKLKDMMATEKQLLNHYQHAVNEVVSDDMRNLFLDNRNAVQGAHTGFYYDLFKLGACHADIATPRQISDAIKEFYQAET